MHAKWSIVAVLLAGCVTDGADAPGPTENKSNWLLATAREQRSTTIKYADVEDNKTFPLSLRIPTTEKAKSIDKIEYYEVDQRIFFRIFFKDDVGWKAAIEVTETPTDALEAKPPTPERIGGVPCQRTKIQGMKPPFMYYSTYHVATKSIPKRATRYWLELDVQ